MEILRFFESIRTPFLTNAFSFITSLGEEYVFIILALVFIWCVDKRTGYLILISGIIGEIVNQILKISFQTERPWITHSDFAAVKSAIPEAVGFSFPSGHTQIAATTYSIIGIKYKKYKALSVLSFALIFLIGISRLYLGVHYPSDVIFSLAFGLLLSFIVFYTFKKENFAIYRWICFGLSAISVLWVFFCSVGKLDNEVYSASLDTIGKFFGATAGFLVAWIIDEKKINFKTEGSIFFQILKITIGVALVFVSRALLKELFETIRINVYVADSIRYFLIVFIGGAVWPYFFSKISKK